MDRDADVPKEQTPKPKPQRTESSPPLPTPTLPFSIRTPLPLILEMAAKVEWSVRNLVEEHKAGNVSRQDFEREAKRLLEAQRSLLDYLRARVAAKSELDA